MANPKGPGKAGPGRPKGARNKITIEIREIAQKHGEEAIAGLLSLAKGSESDSARVAAWREILDRGYGKAAQSVHHSGSVSVTADQLADDILAHIAAGSSDRASEEAERPKVLN